MMAKTRLWNYPEETIEVLSAVLSGADDQNKIAEKIDCSRNTVRNKVHDPVHLGLINKNDSSYDADDEARRIVQLNDYSLLEEKFLSLPGVGQIEDRLENKGEIHYEEIGRIISFETESGAAKEETFLHYGRIYANWFEFLGRENTQKQILYSPGETPEEGDNEPTSSQLAADPQNVMKSLKIIGTHEDREAISGKLDVSEKYVGHIFSTLYALGLAEPGRWDGHEITEKGREVSSASIGNKKQILGEILIELPITDAYFSAIESDPFDHPSTVKKVSENHFLGWSDSTLEIVSKRTHEWLTFTELIEQGEEGYRRTEKLEQIQNGSSRNNG